MKRFNRRVRTARNVDRSTWMRLQHIIRRSRRLDRLARIGYDESWLHSPYAPV